MDASDIPSSLKKATVITLTGYMGQQCFQPVVYGLMDNPAFGTSENTVLQKIDMSAVKVVGRYVALLARAFQIRHIQKF